MIACAIPVIIGAGYRLSSLEDFRELCPACQHLPQSALVKGNQAVPYF